MPHWHGAAVRLRYFGFSFSKWIFGFFRQRTGNRTGNGGRYTHHGHLWFTSRLCRRSPRLTPPERGIVSRFCAPVRDLRTPKTTRLHASTAVTPYPLNPPPPPNERGCMRHGYGSKTKKNCSSRTRSTIIVCYIRMAAVSSSFFVRLMAKSMRRGNYRNVSHHLGRIVRRPMALHVRTISMMDRDTCPSHFVS